MSCATSCRGFQQRRGTPRPTQPERRLLPDLCFAHDHSTLVRRRWTIPLARSLPRAFWWRDAALHSFAAPLPKSRLDHPVMVRRHKRQIARHHISRTRASTRRASRLLTAPPKLQPRAARRKDRITRRLLWQLAGEVRTARLGQSCITAVPLQYHLSRLRIVTSNNLVAFCRARCTCPKGGPPTESCSSFSSSLCDSTNHITVRPRFRAGVR